ncbi:MAG TPA: MFS transporter [Solirubrobacteraceae bacterium]|nr:MFS transporter [Solirubrobacteraceae bacterium]
MSALERISTNRRLPVSPLLLVVCLAQFMVILDVSIVNVALPSIRGGLHFSTTGLQWVVNAYTLTFAGFLMLGGRAADLLGRRRVFLAGTGLFALASLACALADSRDLLLGARALQGFGGAVLSPATLSIVTSSFEAGPARNRAVGIWGAMGALGASSGVLLGGLLTQGFGWPAIFAVNVPLGAFVVAYGLRVLPASPALAARRHFDVTGAVLVTASLVSLTFGIVRTDTLGWGSLGVLAPLLAGVGLLGAFLAVEARVAAVPLVSLGVLRGGQLPVANVIVILLYAAFFPVWFFLTLYLQEVLHYDAIEAGLSFLPMTLSIFAASTLAPRLVARVGVRRVISAGMLIATVGLGLLVGINPHGSYLPTVLPGAVLSAVGMGLSLVPATIVAMHSLPPSQSGMGSGLLNTSRLVGGALGLAVLSTIADAAARNDAASGIAHALTHGFDLAFAVGAALTLLGALLAAALLRQPREQLPAPVALSLTEDAGEPQQAVAA